MYAHVSPFLLPSSIVFLPITFSKVGGGDYRGACRWRGVRAMAFWVLTGFWWGVWVGEGISLFSLGGWLIAVYTLSFWVILYDGYGTGKRWLFRDKSFVSLWRGIDK